MKKARDKNHVSYTFTYKTTLEKAKLETQCKPVEGKSN